MAGTRTLPTAIEQPMTNVPAHNPMVPHAERITMPSVRNTIAASTVRSMPTRGWDDVLLSVP
ncbi:hypothetical protein [Bifidobacterium stellenboschense]|uniref:hypothetical protein n=1 Tax=Bifidobacterium stellenboschense TaxID=762211 RepID=UPI0012EBECE0|nr:hypothetical protein [Bifidobacterium stellenboschense]